MRSDDLTREQARALKNKIGPMVAYLSRLHNRMGYSGFPEDDPLKLAVVRALNAMHDLHMEVQCRSIDGRGRDEVEKPPVDPLFTRRSKPRKHERH
jgi:hypothetical protein